MRLIWILFFGVLTFSSCSGEQGKSQEALKNSIEAHEEKVSKLSENTKNASDTEIAKHELIEALLEYYHTFPEEDYAAGCLSKVHMVYTSIGDIKTAVAYADTLIEKYPKFVDRSQIIESQIHAYELEIRPRNVEKIKMYLKLWLKENNDAPKEKIADMEYHLKYVGMSLEDRIRMNLRELN